MKLFTVYDSKAEAYLPPFNSPTTATAIRSFEAAAMDANHEFHKYAADYTLFEVGDFDTGTGVVTPRTGGHANLGTALQFVAPTTTLGTAEQVRRGEITSEQFHGLAPVDQEAAS